MNLQDYDAITLETMLRDEKVASNPKLVAAIEKQLAIKKEQRLRPRDVARAVGQAAFNLGDEAEAFVRNGFSTGGQYDQIKAGINSEIQQSYDNNPLLYPLEFGVGMAIPGAGLSKLAKGAQTIRGMAGRGALVGGIDGGIGGYGASEKGSEVSGTLAGIGTGMTFGGALGSAVPAAMRFIKGQGDPEAIIREAATRRGITADDLIEQLNRLDPDRQEAMLADTFPELTGTAMGAASEFPFSPALRQLTDRQQTARDRLVNEIPGDNQTARTEKRALTDERSRVANEDYAPVATADFSLDKVANILNDPMISRQVDDALKAYSSETGVSYQALREMLLNRGAEVEGVRVPAQIIADIRQMVAERANRYLEQGDTTLWRKFNISRERIDQRMDEVPGYTQANANFSRASDEIAAIQTGRDLGRTNRSVADDEAVLEETIDPVLRDYIGMGARSQLINDIKTSGGIDGTASPVSVLGPMERRNLRVNAAQVPQLGPLLEREQRFSETFNAVDPKRNSATAMRQEAKEQFQENTAVVGALAEGSPGAALMAAWRKFVGDQLNIKSKTVAENVLQILLKRGITDKQIMDLMSNPDGATELMKFLQGTGVRATTGVLTGGALEGSSLLYEQE